MYKKNVKLENITHKVFIKKSVHFEVGSLSNPEDIQPVIQFQQNARTSVPQHLVGRCQWVGNAAFGYCVTLHHVQVNVCRHRSLSKEKWSYDCVM
ncbi:hypothetical protein AVEN_235250-1 [Araneus ventricosus]|uniref:Uncharacterized protein n=1 Tax=Araneus ventricosus TaxID=182803 RepID=A0A4Y2A395_ARAVE|nr:hypothetical protein AVEN_235250-1 [Araneus ventricosus]